MRPQSVLDNVFASSGSVAGFLDSFTSAVSTVPLSAGIGPGKPIGTPPGHTETTIFGGGNDTMPFFDQGSSNGCGTTSLAMIASYLTGGHVDRHDVDNEIRRWDVFTAPAEAVEYARDLGLSAEMYNNGTWDELKSFVDQGIPLSAIISADNTGDFATLHYVAVVGYGTDASGNEYVMLHDPNHGDDPSTTAVEGDIIRMSKDEFMQKWASPPAGFENFFIAYAPGGTDLPPGRDSGIEGTLATGDGIANITNGLDRIAHPFESPFTFYRGVIQFEAGVVQTLGGGIYGGIQLGGDWVNDKIEDIPVVENLVGPVASLVSGVGAVGSDIVNAVGESLEDLGEGIEKLGQGDVIGFAEETLEAGGELIEGAANAVVDAGGAVVSAIDNFFSW